VSGARNSSGTATTGTAEPDRPYRGRFAPTPSGALHFGSLVAAVASYLDARARGGLWYLRIEDIDPPRERPGAADRFLFDLERVGLRWDGPVLRQSTRSDAYRDALERLRRDGRIRECACSRASLVALAGNRRRPAGEDLYHPPECVATPSVTRRHVALRLRVRDLDTVVRDRCQGTVTANVFRTVGDFVLRRRDGLFAYQLAVVVDDAAQGITDVVRGADLLASTHRQVVLQEALGLPAVTYLHVPLVVDTSGAKLSKSTDAPGWPGASPAAQLAAALTFLRQEPPPRDAHGSARDLLDWAVAHWDPSRFTGVASGSAPAVA
jgi:glutamyl-Q tRNA(Asp) synthetase